jgi:hypothetical protein
MIEKRPAEKYESASTAEHSFFSAGVGIIRP